jgi:hypothetical protein
MSAENDIPEVEDLSMRLVAERPVPSAGFRARLRRRLLTAGAATGPRPGRVRLMIAAYAGSGLLLLAVAAIGVAGAGPFASG